MIHSLSIAFSLSLVIHGIWPILLQLEAANTESLRLASGDSANEQEEANSRLLYSDPLFVTAYEWMVSDKTEGALIRKHFNNETLGELFQIKFVNREPVVIPEQSNSQEIKELGLSVLDVLAVVSPSKSTAFMSKTGRITLASVSNMIRGAKTLIKEAELQTKGKIRFVPRVSDIKNGKLRKNGNGCVDKFGNAWEKRPSR